MLVYMYMHTRYTPWTECSHTCGGGVQYRQLKCMSGIAETDFSNCKGVMPYTHVYAHVCTHATTCACTSVHTHLA